jgi:hypothetical protein
LFFLEKVIYLSPTVAKVSQNLSLDGFQGIDTSIVIFPVALTVIEYGSV